MRGRAFAIANLGYRFARHMLSVPLRPFRGGRDYERFVGTVGAEGYAPLTPAERAMLPTAMRCVSCGLCALACPTLREGPASAWSEPWTFVVGPSRSIDRAGLAALQTSTCAQSPESERVCPMGVPITGIAGMVERLAREGTGSER